MIAWNNYPVGSHRARCPACGRGERDRTLGVTIEPDDSGVAHCFRCGHVERHRADLGPRDTTVPRVLPASKVTHKTLSNYGRDLWAACGPLAGVALDYLTARACRIPPADGGLRWHPSLMHPSGHVGPGLVALVTHAVTGKPMTLHRTWVKPDGRKADTDPPRLLLREHPKQGGVIRLWPDDAVSTGLGVAEGIETALSLAWGYAPVWSCLDAGNLAAFPVLLGIESLVIGTDNDEAGRASAHVCAGRWAEVGWEVALVEVPYGT
jgi:putative DNA primase/helicase